MTASAKQTLSGNGNGSSSSPEWKFWESQTATSQKTGAAAVSNDGDGTTSVAFEIKHRIRGRIRINIPRLAYDRGYGERLQHRVMATGCVSRAQVSSSSRSLVAEYDPKQHDGSAILEQVIVCIQDAANPEMALDQPQQEAPEAEEQIDYAKRLGLPGVALALAIGSFAGLAAPPLLISGTLILAAVPSFKRAWAGIRDEKKLNVDFLDSTAIALLTTTGAFFPPALMIGLIESGEIIRDMTARRTARANLDLLDSLGRVARVERDGVEFEIPLGELVVGDIVVVYPGDQIPVDGTVTSGVGLIDQQKLTGESIPVVREEGQDVLAATLLVDGVLRIEARRTGNDTRAGIVVALMKAAPVHDTRMEDYARKIGDRIVIPTLALGGVVTLATGGNIAAGVSIITLDIGTGIRVSVPTAILASLTFAARNGILIRSGRALEQLAQVDTVVFDKTGTLTQGRAGVVGIHTEHAGISAEEVLQLAASAEQGLTHPVAEAITRHANDQGVVLKECEEWEYRVGQGIATTIDGRSIFVGSHRMMQLLGVDVASINARHPEIESSAASQVYVAENSELLGVILYKDPARLESPLVIASLDAMGMTPYMLSGDMQPVANAVAAELGIAPEHVYAEAFPERKVAVVKQLQESGQTIAFVGDGINDSAALAHASVSISFAGATDMARETADIVLMDDDLSSLILAIRIAQQSMAVVRQNAGIVVGPNLAAMVWAALIGLSPVAAVLVNNGSAIVAEANGFRPLMGPPGWESFKAQRLAAAEKAGGEQPIARLPSIDGSSIDAAAQLNSGDAEALSPLDSADNSHSSNGRTNGTNGHHNGHGGPHDLEHTGPIDGAPAARRTNGSTRAKGSNGGSTSTRDLAPEDSAVGKPVAKRGSRSKRSNGSNGSAPEPDLESVPALLDQITETNGLTDHRSGEAATVVAEAEAL